MSPAGPARLVAWSYVDAGEWRGWRDRQPWRERRPRQGPLRFSECSSEVFPRFGRLDRLSQWALVAAESLGLSQAPLPRETALILGSHTGCLSADLEFLRSMAEIPSPALFTYTLPTQALAEIALRRGLAGETLCLLDPDPWRVAMQEAHDRVASGEAQDCLCLAVEAPPEPDPAWAFAAWISSTSPGRDMASIRLDWGLQMFLGELDGGSTPDVMR